MKLLGELRGHLLVIRFARQILASGTCQAILFMV